MSPFQFTASKLQGANLEAETQPSKFLTMDASALQAVMASQSQLSFAAPAISEAVTEPTFTKADERFGELRQVDQIRDLYLNARRSIDDLRQSALESTRIENALLHRVLEFLRRHGARIPDTVLTTLPVNVRTVPALDGIKLLLKKPVPQLGAEFVATVEGKDQKVIHNDHSALFGSGSVMVDDLRSTESLRHALSVVLRKLNSEIQDKEEEAFEITALLPDGHSKLDALARERVERLEDYLVAQRLLADHWQEVEQAHAERKRIIESHQGLYYVKVRETPLSMTLPDPLDLRSGSAGDVVPGCAGREVPLPEALTLFMNAVLDIPMGDWVALHDLHPHLPGREWLDIQVQSRLSRIASRAEHLQSHPDARLLPLIQENHSGLLAVVNRPYVAASLKERQLQGRAILSLEDLLGSSNPLLRVPAQQLHQRMVAAAVCLLERLRGITPSVRLAWAAAAEADRLPVETPERWTGLAQAEDADFNGVRTLVELVAWWFKQLHPEASSLARTASRNLVRACLLLAVNEDPQELLQGNLKTLPGRFRIGETLRVDLNREPRTGALLQLVDDSQRVIGTLRVDDHDEGGTLTSIVNVFDAQAILTTAFKVSGQMHSPGV